MAPAATDQPMAPGIGRDPRHVRSDVRGWASEAPSLATIEDRTIPGPHAPVPDSHLHTRRRRPAPPVLVFFHGGGFFIGSIDTHDPVCRELAARSGWLVVSVEYRLAPEHPFPAAADDCFAALQWCAAEAASIGGDPPRLAVGGDSAGGNLAAVSALRARDEGGPELLLQALVYPVHRRRRAPPTR